MNLTADVANQLVKPSTSNIEVDELRLFVWAAAESRILGRKHRQVPTRNFFLAGLTTEQRTGSCDVNVGVITFSHGETKNSIPLHFGKNWNSLRDDFAAKVQDEFWVPSNNSIDEFISAKTNTFCINTIRLEDSDELASNNFVRRDHHLNFRSINVNSTVEIFLSNVQKFDREKKKQDAIKQAHKLIDALLGIKSFALVDQILAQVSKSKFTLPVLVAFLASTKRFKEELPNRALVFDSAEEIAKVEIGAEKLSKSIFSNLK